MGGKTPNEQSQSKMCPLWKEHRTGKYGQKDFIEIFAERQTRTTVT